MLLKRIQARLAQQVMAATDEVFVLPIADGVAGLSIGADCTRLTKKYGKNGVTCHVLAGGSMFLMVAGTKAAVEAAANRYYIDIDEQKKKITGITRCPFQFED